MGKVFFYSELYLQDNKQTSYASKTNKRREGEVVCVPAPEAFQGRHRKVRQDHGCAKKKHRAMVRTP